MGLLFEDLLVFLVHFQSHRYIGLPKSHQYIFRNRQYIPFKNGPTFQVKTIMDCSSRNVLYMMKCEGCGDASYELVHH